MAMQRVRVWDWPTRIFHWALALGFAVAWLTAESDTWLSLHVFCGYSVAGLLLFRLLWGWLGSHYARFASFAFGPRAAWQYLRQVLQGRAARHVGHNPAGSVAIYGLLLLLLAVALSGVLTLGAEEQHGALAAWLPFAAARGAKQVHELLATLALLLVGVHLAGVVVESLLHRENLARAMLTGNKLAPPGSVHAAPHRAVAAVLVLALLGFAGWWFLLDLHTPAERPADQAAQVRVAFVGPPLAQNAQWRDECGSCHLSYHPSLLPQRSWEKLLAQQSQHFGSDLALDRQTLQALLSYARGQAAERHATEAAFKIERSIPADSAPVRISETPYWVRKHRDVAVADWALPWIKSKANCDACHLDAQAGTFEDAAMQIPRTDPKTR